MTPESGQSKQLSHATLSIVILEEIDDEREDVAQWLTWVTAKVVEHSDQVLAIIMTERPRNGTYDQIATNMSVVCMRYTIDDDFNVAAITLPNHFELLTS